MKHAGMLANGSDSDGRFPRQHGICCLAPTHDIDSGAP